MHQRAASLSWTDVLTALRASTGTAVVIRDGSTTEPSGLVGTRPAAKGTEFCLLSAAEPVTRAELVAQLESLAKSPGRRFMTSARARVNGTSLLIESVADEREGASVSTVVTTRRPKLGYNPSRQAGDSTTFRNKRIKTG
jgi:hypothetical protein